MTLQPVLINGAWRTARDGAGSFRAVNPTLKSEFDDPYPVSGLDEVEETIRAGHEAALALRAISPDQIAAFLETFADNIERRADELVEMAYAETALPREPRLRSVELPRTINQLRQAAQAARERSWCRATIDTKTNIRSKFGALDGPVVVMGPNNFPFAFNSAAGGDFAAAIAAGNPVIAKANTGHPGTTRIFGEAAHEAIEATDMPGALVQLLYRTPHDVGTRLVSHPLVGATGFTGSRYAGLQLKAAADEAGKPIYLEMSSINPVVILPGAIRERQDKIADEFTTSCTMGAGQFCTNPGLVLLLAGDESEAFLQATAARFQATPPGVLLGKRGPGNLAEAIGGWQEHGAELVVGGHEVSDSGYSFENTLLRVSGRTFLENAEALQTEAFGAVSLYVFAEDVAQLRQVIAHLEGNLTGSIYSDTRGSDDAIYERIEPDLRSKVGRLLNDKMPTGVAVSPAMNHGGPFPATGHPGFTAVGIPWSLQRFAALHSYDNVRHDRLPPELRNENPTGTMWRYIDGEWTQRDVQ